jgi:hypothetical protein
MAPARPVPARPSDRYTDLSAVAEYDGDRIAHLGMNGWSHDSQTLLCRILWFERREGSVGVFAIDSLQIFPADSILRMAQKYRLLLGERFAGDRVIRIGGSEIPDYLIGGDEIGSLNGVSCRWHKAESCNDHASDRSDGRHVIIPFRTELAAFIAASIQTERSSLPLACERIMAEPGEVPGGKVARPRFQTLLGTLSIIINLQRNDT